MLQRFRREAEVASRLDHPGICPVFDAGVEKGIRPDGALPRARENRARPRRVTDPSSDLRSRPPIAYPVPQERTERGGLLVIPTSSMARAALLAAVVFSSSLLAQVASRPADLGT